jgi:transcriptional regulator with XRE-family HTH domain
MLKMTPLTDDTPTRLKIPNQEAQKTQRAFADRLAKLMQDKNMKQSDLARKIWGTTKDRRGYEVARNRDRISAYLARAGIPEPENLQKLAEALDCAPEDLVGPEGMTRPLTRPRTAQLSVQITSALDRPDMWNVSFNMTLPIADAMEMLAIYERVRKEQETREATEATAAEGSDE